ncbi:MAG: hypothetical protein ACLQVL_30785 [Terriglobia bacterium]
MACSFNHDGRAVGWTQGAHAVSPEGSVAVKVASDVDQNLRELGEDSLVAMLVGVGQVAARNWSTKTHAIELGLLGMKTRFDV